MTTQAWDTEERHTFTAAEVNDMLPKAPGGGDWDFTVIAPAPDPIEGFVVPKAMTCYEGDRMIVNLTVAVRSWMHGLESRQIFVTHSLRRHLEGDWGDVDEYDAHLNDRAVKDGIRTLSAYTIPAEVNDSRDTPDPQMWVITDAGHLITTVLFPSEY